VAYTATNRTWVTGELVTAAIMNQYVRDQLAVLGANQASTIAGLNALWGSPPPDGTPATIRPAGGALTTLNGSVTLPQATITVVSTTGYPAAGTIYIGGQAVAYTGKTGTTFTGCTGGAGTFASGATVEQAGGLTIPVTYDATNGKWLSHEVVANHTSNASALAAAGAGFQDAVGGTQGLFAWRELDTAGLKPQFRLIVGICSTVADGTSVDFQVVYRGTSVGGNEGASVAVPNTLVSVAPPTTTPNFKDSGWWDIPAGYTVADVIRVAYQDRKVGGTGQAQQSLATVRLRWAG
jgi:hypothetical protein